MRNWAKWFTFWYSWQNENFFSISFIYNKRSGIIKAILCWHKRILPSMRRNCLFFIFWQIQQTYWIRIYQQIICLDNFYWILHPCTIGYFKWISISFPSLARSMCHLSLVTWIDFYFHNSFGFIASGRCLASHRVNALLHKVNGFI